MECRGRSRDHQPPAGTEHGRAEERGGDLEVPQGEEQHPWAAPALLLLLEGTPGMFPPRLPGWLLSPGQFAVSLQGYL